MKKFRWIVVILYLAISEVSCQNTTCPNFSDFTYLTYSIVENDTIYFHEFSLESIDSSFYKQYRIELDYLLLNYSSLHSESDETASYSDYKKTFSNILKEENVNNYLCKLYQGFIDNKASKTTSTLDELMEVTSKIFYADSSSKRICVKVGNAYTLKSPLVEAFCVATVVEDLANADSLPEYYVDFSNSTNISSFQESLKTNVEIRNLLLNRYSRMQEILPFEITQ